MKKRQLTIEDLAPFLAHKLKFQTPIREYLMTGIDAGNDNVEGYCSDWRYCELRNITPLLHPMSRLTEPILEGGKIPLQVLAEMAFPVVKWRMEGIYCVGVSPSISSGEIIFSYANGVFLANYPTSVQVPDQRPLVRFCYSKHLDYSDLLGQGLAKAIELCASSSNVGKEELQETWNPCKTKMSEKSQVLQNISTAVKNGDIENPFE